MAPVPILADPRDPAPLVKKGAVINPRSTRLDLIEWNNPKTEGQPHPHLWHAGMCRLALRTRTLEKDYQELRSKGIEFWTEPIMFELKDGRQEGFVCCTDPDGTVIELIQV